MSHRGVTEHADLSPGMLVDDLLGQVAADIRQEQVAVLGAQEMANPGAALAVQPVDSIQPLDDAHAPPPQAAQVQQTLGATVDQHHLAGRVCQVIAELHTLPG